METRQFGTTGEQFPILSFGAQRIVDEHDCSEEEAVAILNRAIDGGIRYFDTAWVYSAGQSESRVGLVARHRRHGAIGLTPTTLDRFFGDRWFFGSLRFERDDYAKVTGFAVSNGRSRNLRFSRTDPVDGD